ncbi:hypothetical protein BH11BAC2_BH11BAC2_00060 [soil metagenome]
MNIRQIILPVLAVLISSSGMAQRLELFTSESGKIVNEGKVQRIPYPRTTGFYDYISTTEKADEVFDSHQYFFIYFIVPIDVEEIGMRLISPVPNYVFADAGDVETDAFLQNTSRRDTFFDPWIGLDRADVPYEEGTFNAGVKVERWIKLGFSEDSHETIAQPTGKFTNPVLRISGKTFPAGLYRARISCLKKGNPIGSYVLQLGLIPGIKGIKMSRTQAGLIKS